jgi:hypothetical protein
MFSIALFSSHDGKRQLNLPNVRFKAETNQEVNSTPVVRQKQQELFQYLGRGDQQILEDSLFQPFKMSAGKTAQAFLTVIWEEEGDRSQKDQKDPVAVKLTATQVSPQRARNVIEMQASAFRLQATTPVGSEISHLNRQQEFASRWPRKELCFLHSRNV